MCECNKNVRVDNGLITNPLNTSNLCYSCCVGCEKYANRVTVYEKRIGRILQDELKFKVSNMGYYYMMTALKLLGEDDTKLQHVVSVLYKEVATLHNSSVQRVERAMRHALKNIKYPNCITEELVSVSEFLCRLYEKERLGHLDYIFNSEVFN